MPYTVSNRDFNEKRMVGDIKKYNFMCTVSKNFDGVAVNNRFFSPTR